MKAKYKVQWFYEGRLRVQTYTARQYDEALFDYNLLMRTRKQPEIYEV